MSVLSINLKGSFSSVRECAGTALFGHCIHAQAETPRHKTQCFGLPKEVDLGGDSHRTSPHSPNRAALQSLDYSDTLTFHLCTMCRLAIATWLCIEQDEYINLFVLLKLLVFP